MLKDKHIILGITGGIAAYKSVVLLRQLVRAGAEVQVLMTPSAREFVQPVTLSSLSRRPVITEFFSANTGSWNSHVDLGLWADALVIAPCTACTLAKMATGVADNMLVTTYLSAKCPVFVAPAMDLDMMAHPSTVRNLATLRQDGVTVIEPENGELASGLVGRGRMEEPEGIVKVLNDFFAAETDRSMAGLKVLVTAGPTREPIDPVRYLSNYSTGKMGYAIADEAARRGAQVVLVSGPVSITPSEPSVKVIPVETALQMHDSAIAQWADADIAILSAAVADYAVANPSPVKLKREGHQPPELVLVPNPDIAARLGSAKRDGQTLVGFALETDNELDNACAKMKRKGLDMIVLNSLRDAGAGFGTPTNKVTIIDSDGDATEYPLKSKQAVAADILDYIASHSTPKH